MKGVTPSGDLMKTKSIYVLLALVLAACSPAQKNPAARAEGGVSGGGGGTVPSNAAGVAAVHSAIEQSRLALMLYFNDQNVRRRSGEVSSGALLFDGERTIFDVIRSTAIEVKEEAPCIDPRGEEKDGAAPSFGANSICISAKTLAAKLTTDNGWDQTIALVGHELSHLLGTNEDQAVKIQTEIITALSQRRASDLSGIANDGMLKLLQVRAAVDALNSGQTMDPQNLNASLQTAMESFESLLDTNVVFAGALSAFNARETDLWWGAYWKLQMMADYSCSQYHAKENPRDGICKDHLDQTFGGDVQLSLPEIEKRMNSGARSENPAGYTIRRISNDVDLHQETADFAQIMGVLEQAMRALPEVYASFDGRTPALMPLNNSIDWKTNRAELSADDFHVTTNGMNFFGAAGGAQLNSDPGGPSYWTLESMWFEHDVAMMMNVYFNSDGKNWWVDTIRVSDGGSESRWVTFKGRFFESPLGTPFTGDLDLTQGSTTLHMKNVKLSVVLH